MILVLGLLFLLFQNVNCDCPLVDTPNNDRRTDNETLKIMQYNVEWAFLEYYKGADCPGNGCPWKTENMSYNHLLHVSNIINKFNPDIVNICEIEGCNELNYLINRTTENFKPYLIQGTDTSTGQNVGMLTKIDPYTDLKRSSLTYDYPIEGSQCNYDGSGSTGVSKHFMTTFNWKNMKVAYISLHLIAYPTDSERCAKREAQAKVVQQMIEDAINQGYEIFVIGDFNDYDPDVIDANNSEPISKVLRIIKGEESFYNLTNALINVKQENRYSNWWDKNGNCVSSPDEFVLLDHILMTSALYESIKSVNLYQQYDINCDTYESDHYPVLLELQ